MWYSSTCLFTFLDNFSAGRRKLSLASKPTDLESELEVNQGKGKRVRKATKRYSPNTSKDDGESSDNEYGEAPNLHLVAIESKLHGKPEEFELAIIDDHLPITTVAEYKSFDQELIGIPGKQRSLVRY